MKYLVKLIILIRCLKIQGDLEWKVLEKVRDYGQNVTLFCNVSNCCPKLAGWDKYTPAQQTLFIDLKKGRPNKKYDGKVLKDGYTLVIQNLTKEDLNVSYACVYGSTIGDKQSLLEENVFNYISTTQHNGPIHNITLSVENMGTTQQTGPIDNRNLSAGEIVGIVFGVFVVVLVVFSVIFWKRRREMHRNIGNRNAGSNTDVPLIRIPRELSADERHAIKSGTEDRYYKTPDQKGLVLIVDLPISAIGYPRQDPNKDMQNLSNFFKDELKYQVVEFAGNCMTKTELQNYFMKIDRTYLEENSQDYHSFICAIVGYENEDGSGIQTTDRPITIEEIHQIFKSKPGGKFNGKPKLFMFGLKFHKTVCRYKMPTFGVFEETFDVQMFSSEIDADCLVAWSSIPDSLDLFAESLFIRVFVSVAKNKYRDEHIEDILSDVIRELETNPEYTHAVKYLPKIKSALTKKYFL